MKKALTLILLLFTAGVLKAATRTRTIVVFPFENRSPNANLGWISEAFAEVISDRLASPDRLVITRKSRDAAYQKLEIPPGTPLTLASEYKVAEELGADWAVLGDFKVAGDQLTAHERLLEVHRLRLRAELEAVGKLADLADLQTNLAWRLLSLYDPDFTSGTEESFASQFPPIRLDAFENYIRGLLSTDEASQVHFLTEADRLNPTDHRAAFELGRFYFQQKDYKQSAQWLSKMQPADGGYLESLFLTGVDYFFLGHNRQSEQAFQTLSTRMPLNEVWNNLGVLQARNGKLNQALASFQRAYHGDSIDADFAFNLGDVYYQLKQYANAADYLQKSLAIDPNDLSTHVLLADALGRLGNRGARAEQVGWISAHDGQSLEDSSDAILPQARLKKNYDGTAFQLLAVAVRGALEQHLATLPPAQHARFHLGQGKDLLKQGRTAEAVRELKEAASLAPDDSEVHLVLGQAYEAEGNHQQALDELQTALRLDDSAVTHLWLAHTYLAMNQPGAALGEARAALQMDPGNHDAQMLMDSIQNRATGAKDKL